MGFIRPDIEALPQSGIAKIAVKRLGDPSVIPLWFGEGDHVTPAFIRDAATAALEEGETFYNYTRGTLLLRDTIRDYLARLYAVDVHPDRITVPGSSMLCVTIAAVQDNTRCIFVNSPCNPTGWVIPPDEQQALLEFCRERQILLIADEVYHRMAYGVEAAPSFLTIARDDDPLMIIYGLSKSWAMTGWRLGWVVTPSSMAVPWQIMSENFNTGAAVFSQRAATALRDGEPLVRELRNHYAAGRDIMMDALASHSRITLTEPPGAFYAFPHIEGINSSLDFALELLEAEDVGVAPGYTFGEGNEQHIRICFARSHDQLQEGLGRLLRFLDR